MPFNNSSLIRLIRLWRVAGCDCAAIASLRCRTETVAAGRFLIRQGEAPTECYLLADGFSCRHKIAHRGARQIVSFQVPGDILNLQNLQLPTADHNVQTITAATIASVPIADLRRLARAHPRINDAVWRDTLVDAAVAREWVLNVGRRDAKTRIAHMLCEFAFKRQVAGLGDQDLSSIPMTQEQIADATGLTSVHVNRTVMALRREGVLADGRTLCISDWPRLCKVAGFEPSYMHQQINADHQVGALTPIVSRVATINSRFTKALEPVDLLNHQALNLAAYLQAADAPAPRVPRQVGSTPGQCDHAQP